MKGSDRWQVVAVAKGLEAWGSERDWCGSDPYEGLNATRFVKPLFGSRRGRQAVIQLVKRSPLDLRPLLGIRAEQSAATLAHVASAYARNGFLSAEEAGDKLVRALEVLQDLRCEGFEEPCWGYHFDVQTRAFRYRRGAPNTIATSFAGMALLDAHEASREMRWVELAEGTGDFFLRHVPQTEDGDGAFFGYFVGDRTPIHNASMLVSAFLARLASVTDRADFRQAAQAGVAYALAHQRPNGSWPYGECPNLGWVDGFHTGYMLDCLLVCDREGIDPDAHGALERGLDFYKRELFLPDGTPKYLPGSVYPIDAQCVAQGIQTFARVGDDETASNVFAFALRRMRRRDGAIIFQRNRGSKKGIAHIRWSVAPMLVALTYLLEAQGVTGSSSDQPALLHDAGPAGT
jgi:hypothetical protein